MFGIRHKLLSCFGTSYNAVEEWSFSMRIITDTESEQPSQAQVNALLPHFTSWWNNVANANPATHNLIGIKLAPIGVNGRYPEGEDAFEALVTADPGPASNPLMAPQLALAITLRTNKPRGATSKGRFYIPCPVTAFNTAGQMISTPVAVATGIKTLLDAINATTNVGRVAVLSNPADPQIGGVLQVQTIEVGNVVDTQRRRRESIPETREVRTLA